MSSSLPVCNKNEKHQRCLNMHIYIYIYIYIKVYVIWCCCFLFCAHLLVSFFLYVCEIQKRGPSVSKTKLVNFAASFCLESLLFTVMNGNKLVKKNELKEQKAARLIWTELGPGQYIT